MGSLTPGEGEIWGSNPPSENTQMQIAAANRANRNDERFRLFPTFFGLVINSRIFIVVRNFTFLLFINTAFSRRFSFLHDTCSDF